MRKKLVEIQAREANYCFNKTQKVYYIFFCPADLFPEYKVSFSLDFSVKKIWLFVIENRNFHKTAFETSGPAGQQGNRY